MPYTRQAFLDLFGDADPYEDILGDFEFYIAQVPGYITTAQGYKQTLDASSQGTWDNASRFALRDWMVTIQEAIKLIVMWGGWQGTGQAILDVAYYNALFTEVTAETVISAWVNTTKEMRLWTVLTIDELRREVWNEEIVSFRIAPPLGDS